MCAIGMRSLLAASGRVRFASGKRRRQGAGVDWYTTVPQKLLFSTSGPSATPSNQGLRGGEPRQTSPSLATI